MLRTKPRRTVENYMALPEDHPRVELIRGEYVVTAAPFDRHQIVVGNLYYLLRGRREGRRIGRLIISPLDVILAEDTVVQPYLLFIRTERLGMLSGPLHGAPNLAVEVLSPGAPDRDRFVKRDLYEQAGIEEYWIVDPETRTIEVLSLSPRRTYGLVAVFEENDLLSTPTFPDLQLRLDARIWE